MASLVLAQTEIKTEPIGILLREPSVSVEIIRPANWSIEVQTKVPFGRRFEEGYYKVLGVGLQTQARMYTGKQINGEKFYSAAVLNFNREQYKKLPEDAIRDYVTTQLSFGFLFGYKWITKDRFTLDINSGLNRIIINDIKFIDDVLPPFEQQAFRIRIFAELQVGYRIGKIEEQATVPY